MVSEPNSSQTAAFPVLGQPPTAADSVTNTPRVVSALTQTESEAGANPSLGREVVANSAGSAVLVPAEGAVCLVSMRGSEDTASFCQGDSAAAASGIGSDEVINNGEHFSVIGVLPATASASDLRAVTEAGVEMPVELNADDGYAFQTTTKPVALHFTGVNGSRHSQALFWPTQP